MRDALLFPLLTEGINCDIEKVLIIGGLNLNSAEVS